MTDKEKAIVMAHTGICMLTGDKFQIFHKYVEDIMNRPIMTHELGWLEDEIKEKSKADFMALCANESNSEKPNKSKKPTGSIEINVGDEVTVAGANGIVVREPYPIGSDNELFVLVWYGQHMSSNSLKNVAPTGRHFPQIIEVLEQLRRSCC